MPKLNFAGVPDQLDFKPAPAGVYTLELTDFKERAVQNGPNKGASMFSLTFEIRDENDDKLDGRKVWDNQVFTEKSMFRIKGMLKALGYDIPDGDDAEDVDFEYDDLLGQTLRVRLGVQNATKDPESGKEYPAKNTIAKFLMPDEED